MKSERCSEKPIKEMQEETAADFELSGQQASESESDVEGVQVGGVAQKPV